MSRGDRKAIIVRDRPDLSLSRQCHLLSIARSSVYYAAKGESPANLALMRRIDELFLKYPFYGSRQMARQLRREGIHVGRHRVRRLMRLMGLQAIYQSPRTSVPHPAHRIYPYLLKRTIDRRSGAPHHLHSGEPSAVSGRDHGLGHTPRSVPTVEHHGRVLRRGTERGASSIRPAGDLQPTRAASSPASASPVSSKTRVSRSPWTAGAGAWTTSSSNASGARSSMRQSTCTS